ncbi:MAG: aminotransferase class V-fold PLP-dependent enzyme [Clostridia bacterium]
MIYLDNSASTFKKPKEVINAMTNAMNKFSANPGRAGHKLAIDSARAVGEVREKLKNFVNAPKLENVIFTHNCTDSLNLAILGSVLPRSHVICTINEHNSTLRPLFELVDKIGIEVTVVEPKSNEILTANDILPFVKQNTTHVCVCHISNVDGMIADIDGIGELCQQKCLTFLVDGAQSCGHIPLDMQKSCIDMLAIAPHKGLFAPQGIGVLAFSKKVSLRPIRFGGTGTESISLRQPLAPPEAFEAGTICTPAICALGAGIDFINRNMQDYIKKIDDLTTYLNFELSRFSNVKVYTHPNNAYGVLAFNIDKIASSEVSGMLDEEFFICTRAGLHCAPLKHKWLKTEKQGAVRASLCGFTTFSDCERLVKAVKILANRKL